ncbi:MAG TPA: 5-oxoprolinase subunit PxpB [Gemmatimonadaceae bacterium]|nr:5-oxoprolinase subunit PxpB [Gemmatimonadaceae bacterium]
MTLPLISPLGDTGLTVRFGDLISTELGAAVTLIANAIRQSGIAGVVDVVPSYASLAVFFDPAITRYEKVHDQIASITSHQQQPASTATTGERRHVIRMTYDGDDLDFVAERTRLTRENVIEIHSSAEYRVLVIGFVPGFAYMGELDARLRLPRRDAPRKRVPAGSVAIAESQTGVYPSSTPGGWHLIGHTAERMFDPRRESPALLAVGDRVQFEPV